MKDPIQKSIKHKNIRKLNYQIMTLNHRLIAKNSKWYRPRLRD